MKRDGEVVVVVSGGRAASPATTDNRRQASSSIKSVGPSRVAGQGLDEWVAERRRRGRSAGSERGRGGGRVPLRRPVML